MADEGEKPILVLMKGHPGSGKSTLSQALAKKLKWPIVDKDDVRDCTWTFESEAGQHGNEITMQARLNELSYAVMWKIAAKQLRLGLNTIVDCPLARSSLYESGRKLASAYASRVVVIECRAGDPDEWKRRLELRAMMSDSMHSIPEEEEEAVEGEDESRPEFTKTSSILDGVSDEPRSDGWHKPKTWEDLQELLEGYKHSWEYPLEGATHIVVDTTRYSTEEGLQYVLDNVDFHAK
mmetsp:Transcript_4958/g.17953  ORF Transcript_4958/g.17953 Transcript_4958/m.17953 type:complete len:237 (-) Transcript_4958:830-1540(-)